MDEHDNNTGSQKQGGWTPGREIDFEAVASGVLDAIRPVVEREMREASNQLYGATMEAVQDYLSDNVNFNIRSRLQAAERERRSQWERAEALAKSQPMLSEVITRLENAEEGSIALDDAINGALDGNGALGVTTSLDIAMALAERVLPGWHVTISTHHCLLCDLGGHADLGPANATVSQQIDDLGNYDGNTAAHAHAQTPALALCIAVLKAMRDVGDE